MRSAPLLTLALTAALGAQTIRVVSYPQDTLTFSSGNIVPLGSFPGSGNFEEGRWQELIPNTHLPRTQGVITSISAICQTFTGPINYRSLKLTLSLANLTTLSSTFAANLATPVVVYNHANVNVNWVARQWVEITFDQPFAYDGRSDLVIEIQKECTPIASGIATMATTGNPGRTDLPRTQYTFGMVGSGAATAPTATASTLPLQVRLGWQRTPTMYLNSDRLGSGSQNVFAISGTVDSKVDATASSGYVSFMDAAFSPPFAIPPVNGTGVVMPVFLLPAGSVPAVGPGIQTIPIPNNAFLVGVHIAMQTVVLDVGLGSNLFFTNGTDFIIRTN